MRLEIDIPEHHYNNIMALDSVSLGRVPYKGIIMYTINAIKHGRVLEQEPSNSENPNNSTTKNDLGVDREDAVERLNALKQLIGYDKDSEIVKATQKSLDMAIKALEQEPKTGKWISTETKGVRYAFWCRYKCSLCVELSDYKNFCPNCGAKMVEPQESEDNK